MARTPRKAKVAPTEPEKPALTDEEILTKIAEGESLRAICRDNGLKESTVRLRFQSDDNLAARYARAREMQAHHFVDKIADVAMEAKDAQIGRLQVDTLKWIAARILPKQYGDKVQVDTQHDLSEDMKAWLDQR